MTVLDPKIIQELSHHNELLAYKMKQHSYECISGDLGVDIVMIQRMYEESFDEELVESGHNSLDSLSYLTDFQAKDAFFSKNLNSVLITGYNQADEIIVSPVLLMLQSSPSLGLSYSLYIPKGGVN